MVNLHPFPNQAKVQIGHKPDIPILTASIVQAIGSRKKVQEFPAVISVAGLQDKHVGACKEH